MRNATLISILIGLGPLASAAMAQSVAQPDSLKGDISQFHGDQNTLIGAIRNIEQSGTRRVLDIRFSEDNGRPGYHAVVVKGGRVAFVHIQERSSNVIEIDASSGPVWMLSWRGKSDVHFAEHATVPLTKAIRTAEQSRHGAPAVAAGIARSASNPDSEVHAYTVLLDVDGTAQSISIDDSTGEVISNPGALTR